MLGNYFNSQFSVVQDMEFFIRIFIACLCGACIGLERSKRLKEAGVRTHIIVCCGAALMMIVSKYGFADLTDSAGTVFNGTRGADPARIAAQVVSGISFLGAGVIFKNGNTIKGLTTAAGIWATAGIGLAFGAGMYIMGIFGTIVIAGSQILMHKFKVGHDSWTTNHLQVTVADADLFQKRFDEYISGNHVQIAGSKISQSKEGYTIFDVVIRSQHEITTRDLFTFFEGGEIKNIECTLIS